MKQLKHIAIAAALAFATVGAQAQQFTVALKSGEKVTFNNAEVDSVFFHETIVEPEPPVVAPKIGDFYYSDGTWSTALNSDKTPIGVVFRTGIADDARDRSSFYTYKDGETPFGEFHGYVVALNDATGINGSDDSVWWSPFNDDAGAGCSTSTDDFLGFTNTLSIKSAAGKLTDSNFPAAYYATTVYEETVPAPEKSSGWFLPSVGQLSYMWNKVYFDEDNSGRSCLEKSFKELGEDLAALMYVPGSEYWSSTEKVDSYGKSGYAYYFCFDSQMFQPGFLSSYRKNANFRVRPILAF